MYQDKLRGELKFVLLNGYVEAAVIDREELEYTVWDLMSGVQFADYIEDGTITNYDGSLSDIIVNGYRSNLGIWTDNFNQGEFCVGLYDFRKICQDYNVEVNWANK